LQKKVDDCGSAVSAYLSLKEAASLCRHPTVVGHQNTACTEGVELAQAQLAMVRTKLDAFQERHMSIV